MVGAVGESDVVEEHAGAFAPLGPRRRRPRPAAARRSPARSASAAGRSAGTRTRSSRQADRTALAVGQRSDVAALEADLAAGRRCPRSRARGAVLTCRSPTVRRWRRTPPRRSRVTRRAAAATGPAGIGKIRATARASTMRRLGARSRHELAAQRGGDRQSADQPHRVERRSQRHAGQQRERGATSARGSNTKKCRVSGTPGSDRRIRSSQSDSARPSGTEAAPPMPTSSSASHSTSAAARRRENPMARSAAISPSR